MKGTGLFMKELASKNVKELVAMRREAKKEAIRNAKKHNKQRN